MTERVVHYRRKLLLLPAAWMALAGPTVIAQESAASHAAQSPTKNVTVAKPSAFEVVSIRPSKPADFARGPGVTPDGYQRKNQSLWDLIMLAYFPQSQTSGYWSKDRLLGAPPWMSKEQYDIDTKVDDATAQQWKNLSYQQRMERVKPMLQALLAERCKLVLHTTQAEIAGYALVIGKHGPRLKKTKSGEAPPLGAIPMMTGDGMMVPIRDRQKPELTYFNVSMASFAANFSLMSVHPVLDNTGLTGNYDFVLHRREDLSESDPNPVYLWEMEELGLTLKSVKIPTETLVIDHIERPSPN